MTPAAEGQVVFDDVAPDLSRGMLVMQVGGPVEATTWLARVPEQSQRSVQLFDFELGERVQRHYLHLNWKSREVIGFSPQDVRLRIEGWLPAALVNDGRAVAAVVWWLEAGETISGAFRSAAELFWASCGAWPTVGLMWREPPTAELVVGGCQLSVKAAKWVSAGCVVVL
jgi:hypothetical protein